MALQVQALSDTIFTELKTRVVAQPPAADLEAGLQRLADAIAGALVPYLKSNSEVTVDPQTHRGTVA